MIGYSATTVFPGALQVLRAHAEDIVEIIPEPEGLRCHEVTRIVWCVLSIPLLFVVDGKYGAPRCSKLGPGIDHSWLEFMPNPGLGPMFIIDVYAIGRLPMVQLVDCELGLGSMYMAGDPRKDVDQKQVDRIVVAVRAALTGRQE